MPENLMDQGSGLDIVGRGRFSVSFLTIESGENRNSVSNPDMSLFLVWQIRISLIAILQLILIFSVVDV